MSPKVPPNPDGQSDEPLSLSFKRSRPCLTVVQLLAHYNDTQRDTFAKLRSATLDNEGFMGKWEPRERRWLDERCLLRYLRAAEFNLSLATDMISETLKWRASYDPLSHPGGLSPTSGKIYINSFDQHGHPIMYLVPRHEIQVPGDEQIRFFVFMLEMATRLMEEGVEKLVIVMDFRGLELRKSPGFGVSKQCNHILRYHFVERLHKAFLVEPPWYVSVSVKSLWPFIHPVTRSKIFLVNPSDIDASVPGPQENPGFDDGLPTDKIDAGDQAKKGSSANRGANLLEHVPKDSLSDLVGGSRKHRWSFERDWAECLRQAKMESEGGENCP